MKLKFLLILLVTSSSYALAQHPEIGKPIPAFQLDRMGNYAKGKASNVDLKGRYVILDFWNKGCVSCVASFPKLNQLHEKYKDKLDIILIGTDEKGIEEMFQSQKDRLKLQFPYAYNRPMYDAFVTRGAPHIIWIDPTGTVKAISEGSDLGSANVEAFLRNETFPFNDFSHAKRDADAKQYNVEKPFLVNGNGSSQYEAIFKYRSLISEYIPGTPRRGWSDTHFFRKNRPVGKRDGDRMIFEVCTNIDELYRTAYTGWTQWAYGDSIYNLVQPGLILEISNPSALSFDKTSKESFGFYWYSLIMPAEKATPKYVMESMQLDLKRYFGYEASLETRSFPVLKLRATERARKLTTKGVASKAKLDNTMYAATNIPLNQFLRVALAYSNYWESDGKIPVILNETGMEENVDIDVKIVNSDWNDVQRALKELGFELVPGTREFKVLVIRDTKPDRL